MTNSYIIDFVKLLKWAMPSFLRNSKIMAWIKSLANPLIENYNDFVTFKDDAIYRVSHNGSITLLQKVLNDKFDNVERRIYILNVQKTDINRFYDLAANKEFGMYTEGNVQKGFYYIFDAIADSPDFTVHIPIEYQSADPIELEKYLVKVRSQINYYKLYAKKYKIEWIS